MRTTRGPLTAVLLIALIAPSLTAAGNECTRTAHMQIYSVASVDRETGDLDGYELAIERHVDSTIDAWLYVYEGAPNDDAIHTTGLISGRKMTLRGNWPERQIEYPSKKETVQNHFVEIEGVLDSNWFRGTIKIEGLYSPDHAQLRRVRRLWPCKR